MQRGLVDVRHGDIIANLPYDDRCTLWFDHHHTNKIDTPFNGAFKIAPSAAGVIFDYYKSRFEYDYTELITATDKSILRIYLWMKSFILKITVLYCSP